MLHAIIERASIHEENIRAINTDILTGLDNRNSYEIMLRKMEEDDSDYTIILFDLNGLKPVNDKYGHNKGDFYIKSVASIIKKYWEKVEKRITDKGIEKHTKTGHVAYRSGGDEFVVITKAEDVHLASIKENFVKSEVAMLDLGLGEEFTPGVSYGISRHNAGTSIKQAIDEADAKMMIQKDKWYENNPKQNRRR